MHQITVIKGDGVGPEICDAAIRVIEATGVKCQWDFALVGGQAEKEFGTPLPAETVAPRDAGIPYARATIHAQLGQMNEARRAARRALEVNPQLTEAANLLHQIESR